MLNIIIGTFIGGWLICSVIAAMSASGATAKQAVKKGAHGLGFQLFALFCFFILGPILIGAVLTDIHDAQTKKPPP